MRFAARRWACCLLFAFWGWGEIDAAGPARSHLGSWDDYYVGRVIPDLVATKWHGEQHVGESVVIDVTRIQDDVDQVRHIVRRFNAGELDDFVLQLPSPLVVPYVVVDINGDQQLDFLSAAEKQTGTFLWRAAENAWQRVEFPTTLGSVGGRLAAMRDDQKPTLLIRSVAQRGAWYFHDGQWQAAPACLRGLDVGATRLLTSAGGIDRGLRFHDLTGDGVDELIVANADCQVILQWSSAEQRWRDTGLHWPAEAVFVTNDGADAGCRLADVNGDGRVDLLMSDEERSVVFPWQSDTVGFGAALARTLRDREDATPLPAFVRAGRATGAWFDTGTGNIMAPGDKRGSAAAGPWNRALRFEIAFADVVPGFAKLLANEGANDVWWDYRGGKTPNHFIRQQKRGTRLSWQTAAVPEEYTADRVRFVFVGAMGYRSEPATAGFEMAWEGAAPIAFDLTRQRQSWTNADDTATLVFEPTWQDASDAAGYFFLTVDRKYWTAGQPLSLTVVSKGEGSQRWFAIHPVPHPTRVDTLAGASTD